MHKHSLATMFREWVKRRSDKAYLIWDYTSLNQVEEILTHLCVQTKKSVFDYGKKKKCHGFLLQIATVAVFMATHAKNNICF